MLRFRIKQDLKPYLGNPAMEIQPQLEASLLAKIYVVISVLANNIISYQYLCLKNQDWNTGIDFLIPYPRGKTLFFGQNK